MKLSGFDSFYPTLFRCAFVTDLSSSLALTVKANSSDASDTSAEPYTVS